MLKTPYINPHSPIIRTLHNPDMIPLEGVSTMAHLVRVISSRLKLEQHARALLAVSSRELRGRIKDSE